MISINVHCQLRTIGLMASGYSDELLTVLMSRERKERVVIEDFDDRVFLHSVPGTIVTAGFAWRKVCKASIRITYAEQLVCLLLSA